MSEDSSNFSQTKLEKIQNQIEDLQNQKQKMIHHLEKKVISFLKNEDAFAHNFETLLGGILHILDSLQTKNPSKEQLENHQNWKKSGAQILKNSSTKTKKVKKTEQKSD